MIELKVTIPEGNGYSAETLGRVDEHIRQLTCDRAWFSRPGGQFCERLDGGFTVYCHSPYEYAVVPRVLSGHYGLEVTTVKEDA